MTEREILNVLKETRLQKKLSQEKLSFELGCEASAVGQMESGNMSVTLYRLVQWAKFLGFELSIQPIKK